MPTLYKPTVESLESLKKEAFQGGAVSSDEWRAVYNCCWPHRSSIAHTVLSGGK